MKADTYDAKRIVTYLYQEEKQKGKLGSNWAIMRQLRITTNKSKTNFIGA